MVWEKYLGYLIENSEKGEPLKLNNNQSGKTNFLPAPEI